MLSLLQVIVTLGIGILIGSVCTMAVLRLFNRIGAVKVTEAENGELTYLLQLEEEPKAFLKRRFITFMVDKRS